MFTRMKLFNLFSIISAVFVNSPEFHLVTTTIIGRRNLDIKYLSVMTKSFNLICNIFKILLLTRLWLGCMRKLAKRKWGWAIDRRILSSRKNHISSLNKCGFWLGYWTLGRKSVLILDRDEPKIYLRKNVGISISIVVSKAGKTSFTL